MALSGTLSFHVSKADDPGTRGAGVRRETDGGQRKDARTPWASAAEQSRRVDLVWGDLEDHAAVRADRRGVVVPRVLSRQLLHVPPGPVARYGLRPLSPHP